jgi:Predicted S-adenosylmethionine-dependent methyltransferase
MIEGGEIFIQSDVKDVLDNMRETIREYGREFFDDTIENVHEYLEINPIGIPTEREISVLNEGLPVYRTVFVRNCKTIDC